MRALRSLPRLRVHAESRMTSRATVRRKAGRAPQNEDTGRVAPQWDVVATDLPLRLGVARGFTPPSKKDNPGGVEVQTALRIGHFPAGTALRDADMVEVTAGENAGTVWRITEGDAADQLTAYRVPLLAQQRPKEWP